MNNAKLVTWLKSHNACGESLKWLGDRDLAAGWAECPRGDWLLWLAAKAGIDRLRLVKAACATAREALQFVPAGEDRPRIAIETAEAWCRGEATIEQVREARRNAAAADAAYAAAAAAADAYAAADAAYAAAAADAYAAAAAADAAAYAAAADAAYAAAAADAADAAAYAAAYAAAAAAYAAAYAAAAAAYAARLKMQQKTAEIVRGLITLDEVVVAIGVRP